MYLYYIDNGLLCYSDFIYIVKKKQPIHPRLFIKCNYLNEKKTKLKLFFKSNIFDSNGLRIIENICIESEEQKDSIEGYLIDVNKKEYMKLEKYIKIQKIVLDKRKKNRNYDAVKIINNSIIGMNDFRNDFKDWFKLMKVKF